MKIDTFFRTPVGNGPWPAVFKKGYGITTGDAETFVKTGNAVWFNFDAPAPNGQRAFL